MKRALIIALLILAPAAAAVTEEVTLSVGSGTKVVNLVISYPENAAVGSQFYVSAYLQISVGSLAIDLSESTTWAFSGCTRVSSTNFDSTLSEGERVLVTMTTETCTISGNAQEGLIVPAINIPFVMSVFDPNVERVTSTVALTGSLDIAGALDLNILTWPELQAMVEGHLDVDANGAITVDGFPTALAVTNSGSITLDGIPTQYSVDLTGMVDLDFKPGASLEVTGVEINSTVENLNQTFQDGAIDFDAGGEAQKEFFDYLSALIFLAIMTFCLFRMQVAGPRYTGPMLFAFFGLIGVLFPGFIPLAAAWVGLAGMVWLISVLNRFGATRGIE